MLVSVSFEGLCYTLSTFIKIVVESWIEAKTLGELLADQDGFLFRGHANQDWELSSTLERLAGECSLDIGSETSSAQTTEELIVQRFARDLHLKHPHRTDDLDALSLLALLQHHGGATRLLDFTSSFYVAAFFALREGTTTPCIWAINSWDCVGRLEEELAVRRDQSRGHAIFGFREARIYLPELKEDGVGQATDNEVLGVLPCEPFRRSERHAAQQGLFMLPTNVKYSFLDNLLVRTDIEAQDLRDAEERRFYGISLRLENASIVQVCLAFDRASALRDLARMTIDEAHLFPGLDGLAQATREVIRNRLWRDLDE